MADTTTTVYGFTKPDAGSTGWDEKLNTNFDLIDTAISEKLEEAGGTMTGDIALGANDLTGVGTVGFSNTATGGINGTVTNDAAAAGKVGEYVVASQATLTNFPTSSTAGDLVSIALTAGDWDVTGVLSAFLNGATVTLILMGVSSTVGNAFTGLVKGNTRCDFLPPTAGTDVGACVPAVRFSLAGSATIYLKYYAEYSVATPQAQGRISARRIR